MEVVKVCGGDYLEILVLCNWQDELICEVYVDVFFVFIGVKFVIDWLFESMLIDNKSFILIGRDLCNCLDYKDFWKCDCELLFLEICWFGIFVVGDVCFGVMNWVVLVVGEGVMVIKFVYEYLVEIQCICGFC